MKHRISWVLLLWTCYLLMVIADWKNLKYIFKLFREFIKMLDKNSQYSEDGDFILIHKNYLENKKKI